jgi:urea carboxylase-associated protein 1
MDRPLEPDPYNVAFEETLPARGRTAFVMRAGQVLRIVDVEGAQVADLICFRLDDHADKLSVHNTLLLNETIYITTGHALWSTQCTRMMTIVADTVGVHDLIAGSCSEHTNAVRYGVRGTPSCRANFEQALEPYSIPLREIPYSFNVFMNVPVTRERTAIVEPISKPGDLIDLRADVDLLVAISNCPQQRNPCNAFNPTRLRTLVFEPTPAPTRVPPIAVPAADAIPDGAM